MAEFLDMGGYARYVWSAWGLSAVTLIAVVAAVRTYHGRTLARLRRRNASQGRLAAQGVQS